MERYAIQAVGISPRRLLLLVAALVLFTSVDVSSVFAFGSIGWDEVRVELSSNDSFLAAFITNHFEVSHSGGAFRVGHDSNGNSLVPGLGVGTRLPPYYFDAKPKGTKGRFTLDITLQPTSFGGGKTWQMTIREKRATD